MPTRIVNSLNNTTGAFFFTGEINGGADPFLAVTFELNQGQKFSFHGVTASFACQETSAGIAVTAFRCFGFDNVKLFPEDTVQSILQRVGIAGNDAFYGFAVNQDLGVRYHKESDLFPFPNIRASGNFYTFIFYISLTAPNVNTYNLTATVYGEILNENEGKFPLQYR